MTGPRELAMALEHPCHSSSSLAFPGLFPEGSWSSGKLRGALAPTHLPAMEPLQSLAAGRVLQAQISQLDAKEQATDGFRLQEGANTRSTGPLPGRMASGPAHFGL